LQDYRKNLENNVKELIAEACMSMGINKNEAGFCIGGGGVVAPVIINHPEQGPMIADFAPTWQIAIGLRSLLLGKQPIIKSLPVLGVLPDREDLKPIVYRLVSECDKSRRDQ